MTMQLRKAFISVPAPAPAHMELRARAARTVGREVAAAVARVPRAGVPPRRAARARTHYCNEEVEDESSMPKQTAERKMRKMVRPM